MAYLQRLTGQLIEAADQLPTSFRERHGKWILTWQQPDGGFPGREGGSDLYYTGFALRSLAVLQLLDEPTCARTADFLRSRRNDSVSVVDLFSWMVSAFLVQLGGGPDVLSEAPEGWIDRVAETLESLRRDDGGYAKAPTSRMGSTYTTFLIALALELVGRTLPQPERAIAYLNDRYRDGGYLEIPQMKRPGTNPTAAAVGTLQILEAFDATRAKTTVKFLADMKAEYEGGLRANNLIPAADLLSTFTGSWTLADLGRLELLDGEAIRGYAKSLECDEGGFRGGIWDERADIEYTFYGIGVLALFQE